MKNSMLIFLATAIAGMTFAVTARGTASADDAPSVKTEDVAYGFNSMPVRATTTCVHHFKKEFDWQSFSPADAKDRWNFKIRHKDNPSQILDVTGLLEYKKTIKNAGPRIAAENFVIKVKPKEIPTNERLILVGFLIKR